MTASSAALTKILRIRAVQSYLGLSRASIYRLEKNGGFPSRVRLGIRAVGWDRADLDAWIQARRDSTVAHGERKTAIKLPQVAREP